MQEVHVLIVEDNSDLLDLLLQALPALGPFHVTGAPDGFAGLLTFEKIHPDCVVVDVRMPELNGYQFVRALRGDPQTAATPLIILTALTQDRDRFIGLASGVDLFLTKPVLPFDLAQAILQVMARSHAERESAFLAFVEQQEETEH
ncbi:MAG TPA: response regulator [Ktedonobacterales bacterium]|nr:response regulator [Ktedonobacterales bacterium]